MDTVEILINKGVDLNCLNLVSTKRISLKTYIYIYICLLVCIFHVNVYLTYVQRMQSPIHIAAEMGHTEICELLLASGANIEQREQVERLIPYDMEFFFILFSLSSSLSSRVVEHRFISQQGVVSQLSSIWSLKLHGWIIRHQWVLYLIRLIYLSILFWF